MRFGAVMTVTCLGCGHEAEFSAMKLWPYTDYKNGKYRSGALSAVAQRMKCSRCGSRRVDWGPVGRD